MADPTARRRPDTRDVNIWTAINAALVHIRDTEFYLGLQPSQPIALQLTGHLDMDAVATHLMDARIVLADLANDLAEEAARA